MFGEATFLCLNQYNVTRQIPNQVLAVVQYLQCFNFGASDNQLLPWIWQILSPDVFELIR